MWQYNGKNLEDKDIPALLPSSHLVMMHTTLNNN